MGRKKIGENFWLKMKQFFVLIFVLGRTGGQKEYMIEDEGEKRLTSNVFNTMISCNNWIHEAIGCKGEGKMSKYQFRTSRVLKDVLWHVLAVKRCTVEKPTKNRSRRSPEAKQEERKARIFARKFARYKKLGLTKKMADLVAQNDATTTTTTTTSTTTASTTSTKAETTTFSDEELVKSIGEIQYKLLTSLEEYDHIGEEKIGRAKFNKKVTADVDNYKISIEALYDSFKQLGDKQESVSTGLGRSDTSFTDVLNDFSEMDGEERMSESKKLERACRKGIQRIWLFDEVESCPKLGSWKRRTDHLHNDISKLEQHCSKKQKRNLEEAEEAEEEIEEAN